MAWYCDRCGQKQSSISSAKWNSKHNIIMENHEIPSYINICGSCGFYLFPYQNTWWERLKDDAKYLKEPDSEFYKKSRFYEDSRNFDIEYNLLDPETNLYWDEDYTEVIDFTEHYEELEGKFSSTYDEVSTDESENETVTFVSNANEIIHDALHEKSTTAWYESLKEDAEKSYETTFTASLQNFVTRLGLIISEVSNVKFYGKSHYAEILEYICKQIIDDEFIYNNLIKLNTKANASKHSKKNIDVDIDKALTDYNSMIDKLVSVSDCKVFEICHVYKYDSTSDIECSCCGRIKPKKYYRCKICRKIICDECFNRDAKMCCECAKKKDKQ